MLYDPKWEHKTKTDPFSLLSLIEWMEKQPPTKTYCYVDNGMCLLAQYFQSHGFTDARLGSETFWWKDDGRATNSINLPDKFNDIATGHPRNFGAALDRARASQTTA